MVLIIKTILINYLRSKDFRNATNFALFWSIGSLIGISLRNWVFGLNEISYSFFMGGLVFLGCFIVDLSFGIYRQYKNKQHLYTSSTTFL
jgi:hypothetical protein